MEETNKKKKNTTPIIIGVLIFSVLGLLFLVIRTRTSVGGGDSSDSSFSSYLPIWIAVIAGSTAGASKKKDMSEADKKTKLILLALLGVAV